MLFRSPAKPRRLPDGKESLSFESTLMTQQNMINYIEEYRAQNRLINDNHGLLCVYFKSTGRGRSITDFLNIQVFNWFNALVSKGWSLYSILFKQS